MVDATPSSWSASQLSRHCPMSILKRINLQPPTTLKQHFFHLPTNQPTERFVEDPHRTHKQTLDFENFCHWWKGKEGFSSGHPFQLDWTIKVGKV